jgi:hypothetical protein
VEITPDPMQVICDIAQKIGHIGSFIIKHTHFYPNAGAADKEDIIIITPANESSQGSVAIKTLIDPEKAEEKIIVISAKEGPAREFAQTLLQRCQADPALSNEKITLLDNKKGRCCQ